MLTCLLLLMEILQVVRAIISMLKTTLVVCDEGSFRRVFKALLNLEKDEKKRVQVLIAYFNSINLKFQIPLIYQEMYLTFPLCR